MTAALAELEDIVAKYLELFKQITEDQFAAKPNPKKWSKKEVLGHLIDSAQNNLRRFICAQYEENPKIVYNQDFWVDSNHYQKWPKDDLLELWRLVNQQIVKVLQNMPRPSYSRTSNTGGDTPPTLEWLAADYVKHLKHHINQIIPHSFPVTYP